ncbi:MAG: Rpn family recombination-promoting nuclease/putative transposase [Leptospirales bacterium]
MGDVALHDSFFKATLGQTGPLSVLLKGFLPPQIARALDFDSLQSVPTESVDDSLDRSFMDLAFSARLSGTEIRIYLLVEHKSSPDPETFLQLLRYMVALWMRNRKEGVPLTPVLPFVFHHGERRWNLPRRFADLMNTPEVLRSIALDFAPEVLDVGPIPDEEIRKAIGDPGTLVPVLALKHIFGTLEEALVSVLPLLRSIETDGPQIVINYLLRYHGIEDPEAMKKISEKLVKEENMPNVVDILIEEGLQKGLQEGLQRGRQEGLQKGLQEGLQKGQRDVVVKLLEKGVMTPAQIASALDLDLSRVQEIQAEIDRKSS